jgi:hypothetical protein
MGMAYVDDLLCGILCRGSNSTVEIHAHIAMRSPNASRSGGSGKGCAVPA